MYPAAEDTPQNPKAIEERYYWRRRGDVKMGKIERDQ